MFSIILFLTKGRMRPLDFSWKCTSGRLPDALACDAGMQKSHTPVGSADTADPAQGGSREGDHNMNPRIHTRPFGRYSVLLCFTVALLTASPQAQNSQGTILGHVQDSSGAALPGVRITATNVNTNVTNHFTTNGTGDYVLVDLIPGTYQVRVEADGFKSEVSGNLILEVDQTLRQNFTLQVGQIKEVMTVTADAQMV